MQKLNVVFAEHLRRFNNGRDYDTVFKYECNEAPEGGEYR